MIEAADGAAVATRPSADFPLPSRQIRRAALLALACAAFACAFTAPASAATGDLTQKASPAGCIADDNTYNSEVTPCTDGRALSAANSAAVSPDGKNVYVGSQLSGYGGIAVFDRNTGTGELTQKAGAAGCIVENPAASAEVNSCADGVALQSAQSVTVSPVGRQVYVTSLYGLAIFDRDTTTGALTQKPGTAGCIVDDNTVAAVNVCADGKALAYAGSAAIPPDGKNVYVTSYNGDSLAVLTRNPANGLLTQSTGTDGCYSETGAGPCADGRALDGPNSVITSPDGNGISVYVTSSQGGRSAVAVFDRDRNTGILNQEPGTTGCVAEDNTVPAVNTCADGRALDGANSLATSLGDQGKSLYVGSGTASNGVAVFDRNITTGALTQKPGAAGCLVDKYPAFPNSETASCAGGHTLGLVNALATSPDDRNLYVANYQGAVVTLDRNTGSDPGALTQRNEQIACTSKDGTSLYPDNTPGACLDGSAVSGASSLALAPDGANGYLTAEDFNAVAIFDRVPETTPPPDTEVEGSLDAKKKQKQKGKKVVIETILKVEEPTLLSLRCKPAKKCFVPAKIRTIPDPLPPASTSTFPANYNAGGGGAKAGVVSGSQAVGGCEWGFSTCAYRPATRTPADLASAGCPRISHPCVQGRELKVTMRPFFKSTERKLAKSLKKGKKLKVKQRFTLTDPTYNVETEKLKVTLKGKRKKGKR